MANKTMICGFVTQGNETKSTTTGKQVINFSVNFRTTKQGDEYKKEYVKVEVWDRQADTFAMAQQVEKGDTVVCFGEPYIHKYTNKDGEEKQSNSFTAELIVIQRQLLGATSISPINALADFEEVTDEDLPF